MAASAAMTSRVAMTYQSHRAGAVRDKVITWWPVSPPSWPGVTRPSRVAIEILVILARPWRDMAREFPSERYPPRANAAVSPVVVDGRLRGHDVGRVGAPHRRLDSGHCVCGMEELPTSSSRRRPGSRQTPASRVLIVVWVPTFVGMTVGGTVTDNTECRTLLYLSACALMTVLETQMAGMNPAIEMDDAKEAKTLPKA